MKQRLNKLLAIVLSAALCLPMTSAECVNAAGAGAVFTDMEQIFVNNYGEERSTVINDSWKFHLGAIAGASGKELNDADWNNVDLPHDFSITQDFTSSGEAESGFLPGGTGWYRKHFTLSEALAGKRIVLNFDGVYSHAAVYVNGTKVGEHHYGYTPFAFDITDYVVCDSSTDNVIAVEAVNNIPSSRWYSGSGIYRDVKLVVTDAVHVAMNGTYVTTPGLKDGDNTVNTAVEIQNDGAVAANVTVRNSIFEKGGKTALETSQETANVPAGGTVTVNTNSVVSGAKLWSVDEPNLYFVRTEILKGSTVLDTYDSEFGFKYYEFVGNEGFKLNGEPVKINGVCMHHDQGALGAAAYRDAIYRQMTIMKEMGVNTIRVTHNPAAEVLVDVCNELGLLVIEEAFDGWAWPKNGNINDFSTHFSQNLEEDNQIIGGKSSMTWAEFAIKAMVKRDRNDASVILWSLGNEIQEGTSDNQSWDWGAIADDLIKWTKEIDTVHPVTSGSNRRSLDGNIAPVNRKVYESGGVPGYNYGDIGSMNSLHEEYPVLLWSETASAINSRGVYTDRSTGTGAIGGHLTSYDESCVGWGKTAHDSMWPTLSNDYIAGECVWTGFDYIGEPTPWNGTGVGIHSQAPNRNIAAPNSSYFGIVETTGFPKDNYYLYRSQWNQDEKTLHLVTAWDADNMKQSGGKTPVWVYTNAAKVELYRGNTLVGTATRKALNQTTTAMGHKRYEYTTQSNNANICTTNSGSGSSALYSVFNVVYEEGTISAKAYDESGKEITSECAGRTSVSTPGEPSRLIVSQDKEEILADGSSLVYISVDVTDENGNLDTAAVNDITFDLQGNGVIMGVDNGDQATIDKYQQASVITSSTSAHIKAYAGKALAIVRSTTRSGGFTVDVSADGLTGGTAEVATKLPEGQTENAITSYRMSKHCYVPVGSASIALPAQASVVRADGREEVLKVAWSSYDVSKLQKAGLFNINGTLGNGADKINIGITVHVYGNIVAARNVATYTASGMMPALPTALMTYAADGTEFEAFPVTWETAGVSGADFAEIGTIKTIKGTVSAPYIGKTFPVTASVRVAKAEKGEITNIAPSASELSQNCSPVSDNLNTVKDGNRNCTAEDQASRWTDWDDARPDKDTNPPAITMKWDTVHEINEIRLYYANNLNGVGKPKNVTIKLSADGINFTEMGYAEPETIPAVAGESTEGAIFRLNESTNPIAVQVVLERDGACVGLTEIEVMSALYTYDVYDSADLDSISIGGIPLAGFSPDKTDYVIDAVISGAVTAASSKNAAITVLPVSNGTVNIYTTSEDGKTSKKYTLKGKVESQGGGEVVKPPVPEPPKEELKVNQTTTVSGAKYKVTDVSKKTVELVSGNVNKSGKLTVDKVMVNNVECTVTSIAANAFKKSSKITSVKIGNGVKSIGKNAFANCTKLTSVIVGSNVITIGKNAFKDCKKLKSVTIGKKVKTIDASSFSGCKLLNKLTFKGTNVKNIKGKAFKGTAKSITVKVPKSLKGKKRTDFKNKLIKAGISKNVKIK